MLLRPYQTGLVDKITEAGAAGHRRILATMPTGSGKTHVFSWIVNHASKNGKNVLVLVHRREILFQTRDKLKKYGVENTAMLSGELYDQSHSVIVASIPTMHSWVVRRKKEAVPRADLVIIDECAHLQSSRTWADLVALYPDAFIVGFTATPISKAGKGLGGHFDCLVAGPTISELTRDGWLVPVKYWVPTIPDLRAVKVRSGDYAEDQLERAMDKEKLIGDICENWSLLAQGRKTLVFAVGVKHSIHIAESFNKLGVKAEHVDGNTPAEERAAIIKRFSEGDTQVMTSCGVFLEGFDAPIASAIIFARPTKSLMLFLQAAGRGLRPFPGKRDLYFLDHSGAVYEHGTLDQDFDWKLEYLAGDVEKRYRLKQEKKRKSITCGNCKLLYEKRLDCPDCGWKPTIRGKPVETLEGYLVAIDAAEEKKNSTDEAVWYRQLVHYAAFKGYKPGYAAVKFKERFGRWPPGRYKMLEPMEPDLIVKSWIRSRDIAWAHSRRNPGNQRYHAASAQPAAA